MALQPGPYSTAKTARKGEAVVSEGLQLGRAPEGLQTIRCQRVRQRVEGFVYSRLLRRGSSCGAKD